MASAQGIRARNRAAIEQAILDTARLELARVGAAALSLRAVARELEMAPSGIYRYVSDRDELLTRLIVDAYDSLADAVLPALRSRRTAENRWVETATRMRSWALQHPHEWALLYGSPVPDYEAPASRTNDAGSRILLALADLVAAQDGEHTDDLPSAARTAAREWSSEPPLDGSLSPATLLAAVDAWTLVIGAVSREVFGHLGPLPDPEAIFESTARRSAHIALGVPATT